MKFSRVFFQRLWLLVVSFLVISFSGVLVGCGGGSGGPSASANAASVNGFTANLTFSGASNSPTCDMSPLRVLGQSLSSEQTGIFVSPEPTEFETYLAVNATKTTNSVRRALISESYLDSLSNISAGQDFDLGEFYNSLISYEEEKAQELTVWYAVTGHLKVKSREGNHIVFQLVDVRLEQDDIGAPNPSSFTLNGEISFDLPV